MDITVASAKDLAEVKQAVRWVIGYCWRGEVQNEAQMLSAVLGWVDLDDRKEPHSYIHRMRAFAFGCGMPALLRLIADTLEEQR